MDNLFAISMCGTAYYVIGNLEKPNYDKVQLIANNFSSYNNSSNAKTVELFIKQVNCTLHTDLKIIPVKNVFRIPFTAPKTSLKALCIREDEQFTFEKGRQYEYEIAEDGEVYTIAIDRSKYRFTSISRTDFNWYFTTLAVLNNERIDPNGTQHK